MYMQCLRLPILTDGCYRPCITLALHTPHRFCHRINPLPCGDQACRPSETHPNIPVGHPHLDVPRSPFIGLFGRAVPHTGTEMEARPFGTDPETATGATPEPTYAARKRGF